MSTERLTKEQKTFSPLRVVISAAATILFIGIVVIGALVALTPAGQTVGQFFQWLFAANSIQIWWYVTRSAGIIAYLLLWFSTILGLAVSSKQLDIMLDRMFTYDFHQFISLLSIGFLLVHILVLLIDRYLPYTVAQILVPFLSPYRPVWVGVGVITMYVILLVTVTFYLKRQIGMKAFRVIHIFSLLGYVGGLVHGIFAGTDTALPAMQWVYRLTGLGVVFFTVYWLVMTGMKRAEKKKQANLSTTAVKRNVVTR